MAELLFRTTKGNYFTVGQINEEGDVCFCMYNHVEGADFFYEDSILGLEELQLLQEWIQKEKFKYEKSKIQKAP